MSTSSTNFLTSLGAGSGIDSKSLAQNLATAEIQPQKDLVEKKITKTQNKISGYAAVLASLDAVKKAFQAIENPSSVVTKQVSSSQSSAFTATAGAGAAVGNRSIQISKLAQEQRSISDGFPSSTAPLNGGRAFTLQLSVNGAAAKTIRIPALAASPDGMALAINSAGLGLKASVVNTSDGSANPYRLVVTGETGAAKNFTLTSDDGTGPGEQQTLSFGAATKTGNITVAGVNVAVNAGDSASVVAQKVATALTADSIVTGTSGRSATYVNPGQVRFTYAGADGDVSDITYRDADSTGVLFSTTQSRAFATGSTVSGIRFTADASRPAQDAELVVDGISVKRSSNEIKDLINGVTLNLLGTTSGTASLSVNQDTSGLKDKLNGLVTAYNNAIADFKVLTGPPNEKDKTDVYSGSLQSDSTVSYVSSTLKNLFLRNSSTTSGEVKALRDVGISYQRDGTLSLDEAKLSEALAKSPDAVVTMLTADRENKTYFGTANRGMAGDAIKNLNDMIASTGQINTQSTNANGQLTKLKDKLSTLNDRFTLLQTRYAKQFATMDSFVGQTNSLKTSLQSSFAGMMSMYTNKN